MVIRRGWSCAVCEHWRWFASEAHCVLTSPCGVCRLQAFLKTKLALLRLHYVGASISAAAKEVDVESRQFAAADRSVKELEDNVSVVKRSQAKILRQVRVPDDG